VPEDDQRRRLLDAIETLEGIVDDRGRLLALDEEEKKRLTIAAGRVSRPDRADHRKLAKARRRERKEARRAADEAVLDATGIRAGRRASVFETPRPLPPGTPSPRALPEDAAQRSLEEPRKCYVCKTPFRDVHEFYDQMCPSCAALNWEKRNQAADLRGRYAVVTGARVKIGYQAAIKLLRAGAHVVVLTRFPRDAAARYAREADFGDFAERLVIHGIDLRHTPSVELLADHLTKTLPRLDYLVNNACQTVRRPAGFYAHLLEAERGEVDGALRPLLSSHTSLRGTEAGAMARLGSTQTLPDSVALSQAELLPEDRGRDLSLFPDGHLDADMQQVDLRGRNSWRLLLHEVPSVELLEVHLVNAVAPYVLNGRLRELMARTDSDGKHIVNVSAMEGQFYREWKTARHPHTNMAKAALNMMTRTSAEDYLRDSIHMNSVDTGWVTDEDPAAIAERKTQVHGFHPPLDIVDGAARILDPIFHGENTGEHLWGLFLKDYRPAPW
jgi:NAD(P)-dependent dehydrogenase (short-subunit alcohol dehydrogenase family)